jgi:hypothetical protein
MGLPFILAAGRRKSSHSEVRVPWDSRPYFTVSDSRLPQPAGPGLRIYILRKRMARLYLQAVPFSSTPTTRRATVEVFDPASFKWLPHIWAARTYRKHVSRVRLRGADHIENPASSIVTKAYLPRRCLAIEVFVVEGMRLPSRCLAVGIHVTILSSVLYVLLSEYNLKGYGTGDETDYNLGTNFLPPPRQYLNIFISYLAAAVQFVVICETMHHVDKFDRARYCVIHTKCFSLLERFSCCGTVLRRTRCNCNTVGLVILWLVPGSA